MKYLLVFPLPPDEQPEGACRIEGLEPWHIATSAPYFPKIAIPQDVTDSAEQLRLYGPSVLTPEHRALWHKFYTDMKPALGTVEPVDVTEAVKASLKLLSKGVDQKDVTELEAAMERAEHSLVCRSGDVGLFAARGAMRATSLPSWAKAAVVVNTKDENVEVLQVGHCPVLHLAIWCNAAIPGPWTGHRYRIRRKGLMTIRELHFAVNGLHRAVCPHIPALM
jgi:hypothetical protein